MQPFRHALHAAIVVAVMFLFSCGGGGGGGSSVDRVCPVPGNAGLISFTGISRNLPSLTLTLEWTKGTDNVTPPAALCYRVYRSDTANLDNPDFIDINGTEITDGWTVDINNFPGWGLSTSENHYFNVLLGDENGNCGIYTQQQLAALSPISDYIAQTDTAGIMVTINGSVTVEGRVWIDGITDSPGNEGLITTQIGYGPKDSCPSNGWTWGAATYERQEYYEDEYYYVYRGSLTSSQSGDFSYCFRFSIDNGATWFYGDTDGSSETVLYDTDDQGALTVALTDIVSPVPGNGGTLEFTAISRNLPQRAFTLLWTKGTDDITGQSALQYRLFRSTTDNLNDAATIETNGTEITADWVTDIDTFNISNPDYTTNYYFNVLIRDGNDNRAVYTAAQLPALGSFNYWAGTYSPPSLFDLSDPNYPFSTVVNTPTGFIYCQVYVENVTNEPDNQGLILSQVGYGLQGSCPSNGWIWQSAEFNQRQGNNYEYKGTLTVYQSGTYSCCYRFSYDNGYSWFYGDTNGGSSNITTNYYETSYPGQLTVNP